MRIRLFELLGRLVHWRSGSQDDQRDQLDHRDQGNQDRLSAANGKSRDPRASAEPVGRHRRSAGQANGCGTAGTAPRTQAPPPPLQPPAGLPHRGAGVAGPVPRTARGNGANGRNGQAMPLPRNYTPGQGGGIGRVRIRDAPFGAAPLDTAAPPRPGAAAPRGRAGQAPRQPWYQVVGGPPAARRLTRQADTARPGLAATRNGRTAQAAQPAQEAQAESAARSLLPFAAPHSPSHPVMADGRRSCGPLEAILWRQWDPVTTVPPPQVISAIDRLAEFPRELQEKLAAGLDGIYVGAGGVPDLDDMAALHGVPLPSGKATWDACAGAYGDRKIVVGTRPSPTPDVMCHEVGHALDDLDSPPGKWQSDSAEFRLIYDQCQPYIASEFHRQRGGLGRKEFFADSFAAIASAQRPALVDMLGGNTRIALRVMLYFNKRYGI
jgi:hypothetical protein